MFMFEIEILYLSFSTIYLLACLLEHIGEVREGCHKICNYYIIACNVVIVADLLVN